MDRCIPIHRTRDRSDGLYLLCQYAMSVCAETTRRGTKTPTDVCWMQTIVLSLIERRPSSLIRWKINAGSHLYNAVTGQIAPEYVNVADSLLIGERMAECYSASLPGGFYAPISCPINTMGNAMNSKRNQTSQQSTSRT